MQIRIARLGIMSILFLCVCLTASGAETPLGGETAAPLATHTAGRPAGTPTPSPSGMNHKVRVSDPQLAAQLMEVGRVIADYGGYQVFAVDEATLANIASRPGVQLRDDYDIVLLNSRAINTASAEGATMRQVLGEFFGRRLHLVQFAGPIEPAWQQALQETGVRIVSYVPSNAFLVYGDHVSLKRLQELPAALPQIQWDAPLLSNDKIHPGARTSQTQGSLPSESTDQFSIQLVEDPSTNPLTIESIASLASGTIRSQSVELGYVNLVVRLPVDRLDVIALRPDVVSIQPDVEPKLLDERQNQILAGSLTGTAPSGPGYLAWLSGRGFSQAQFTASNFAVDVSDSGIDNGTTTPNHFGLYSTGNTANASRVIYNRLEGTAHTNSTIQGCDGHGTLNAHIVAGYNDLTGAPHTDADGFRYGLGVCPFVQVGSSVIFDPDAFTSPDFEDLQSRAYRDGARISTNSWGAPVGGAYSSSAQRYDALVRDAQPAASAVPATGNQEMVIVFSAGNSGSGTNTIGSPGTAKNVLTVGAAENVRSHSTANGGNNTAGRDGCGTDDTGADSADDIIDFSSRGPCDDQRRKPDIVGPGTHVTGGVAQDSPPPAPTSTGNDLACFRASGVCALPGRGTAGDPDNFFPMGQEFYTTSSGTSHSTPAVAGGAALLRQDFINRGLSPPTPAMTKAYLMNSARYLTGVDANDTLWSNNQGMGEMNLGLAFDGAARILRDQRTEDVFTASGQTRTFTGLVRDASRPFRVTLAWTDAPGSTVGNAFNNDLDLTVTVGGNTYLGNVFSGATSTTGGSADIRNNVESVFLPAGFSGVFVVTITAANINSDGIPNTGGALDQDFALVVYNGSEAADLSITKTDSPDPVLTGHDLTYAIATSNSGPSPAQVADWTDLLPVVTTFQSLSAPAGWSCIAPPVGSTGSVSCTNPSLPVDLTDSFSLVVNVDCSVADGTVIGNTASVHSSTFDQELGNNSATVTTVASNPPPVIGSVSAVPPVLWPPNHRMVDVTVTYTVIDNCGVPDCTLSASSNEPTNGLGDGDASPDWEILDDSNARLRSERAGTGDGRTYSLLVLCTDSAGGSTTATTAVQVPHDRSTRARSSKGFNATGTGFLEGARTFDVAVLSTSDFDARLVDPRTVRIGASERSITTDRLTLSDFDCDGRADLVLTGSVPGITALRQMHPGVPVAVRFSTLDGVTYLVEDIFALGAPVPARRCTKP